MKDCVDNVVFDGFGWDKGRNGAIFVTFPRTVFSWTMTIDFDSDVKQFQVWNGHTKKLDDGSFEIRDKGWNGDVDAGDTLELGFQIRFDNNGGPPPNIRAISLGSDYVCGLE